MTTRDICAFARANPITLIYYFVFFALLRLRSGQAFAVKLSSLFRFLETIFLYGCHSRIEGRFKLRPAADLPVSIPHRFVSEYFLDGNWTLQPTSLDHFLNDSFDCLALYAAVHRQCPTVDPIGRRSDKEAPLIFVVCELS